MFFVDRMLGRLARKLRLLGFDTMYLAQANEEQILQLCKQSNRTLITRDRALHMRALKNGLGSHLIRSDNWKEQLVELSSRFDLSNTERLKRCSLCNAQLIPISIDEIRHRVPLYVQNTQSEFFVCPVCDRIYWAGSHVQHAVEEFRRLGI